MRTNSTLKEVGKLIECCKYIFPSEKIIYNKNFTKISFKSLLLSILGIAIFSSAVSAQEVQTRIGNTLNRSKTTSKNAAANRSAAVSGSIDVANASAGFNEYNADQLVRNVLTSGCLKISNVRFGYYEKGRDNSWTWNNHNWSSTAGDRQLGYYSKASSTFAIEEGILLSTGKISSAMGPNSYTNKSDEMLHQASDPDLAAISGKLMHDASILEFDFIPDGNLVEFKFVFASEEYLEYVHTDYNDAFGFFLSGFGISGQYTNNAINLAQLPNGDAVTINNIHSAGENFNNVSFPDHNADYYIDNPAGTATMEFDGTTVVLTATYAVTPGKNYKIKMAVADASDQKMDTGVFLKAKSFGTNTLAITNPSPICANETTDITLPAITAGSTSGLTYSYWKDSGATVPFTTPTTASVGTYYIKGFNTQSGCYDIKAVIVSQTQIVITETASCHKDVNCKGDATGTATVSASGGIGTYTYSWNTNPVQTTATANNLTAGTYTVTVTDSNSCTTGTKQITITEPSNVLTATTSQADIGCYGCSSGSATVTPSGGTGPYIYSWNTNPTQTTSTASNLAAGTYTVTVTDSNHCTITKSLTIKQPIAALSLEASSKNDISCFGENTGTVTAGTITNAVGNIIYSWKNTSNVIVGTTASVTNLPAGTYTLTVTDNCSSQSNSVTINQPGLALSCSITQDKTVSANGLNNGEATVTAIGGTGNYTYLWDNNESTPKATKLNAGLHSVKVTDANGCTTTCTITITEPNILTCSITQDTSVKCFGDNNGKATVHALGGNGDYIYLWDNNETTAQAIALNAGLHSVTVTDKLGYTTTCSITITQPQKALKAVTTQINVSCGGRNTGSATVIASGGTSPYTYVWNTNPAQNASTAASLIAGTYNVIVTDANSCSVTKSVTILDGDLVKPIIDPLPGISIINCPSEPVFAQATASDDSGAIASLTYEDTTTAGNCAGSYTKTRTWTAKDACGNTSDPVSQVIIVQDNIAPIWITKNGSLNKTIECSNTQALASAQALFPVASDLCDADVTNIIKVSGQFVASTQCSNSGTYRNTWTVKDECGNISDTFTQVITIQDTTAPIWTTQNGSLNKTVECSNTQDLVSAQALFPVASDLCDADVTNILKVSGQFVASTGCSNSGTYTNTWTVKDECGNISDTFTQVITIQDTTAPTWTTQNGSLNKTVECSNTQDLVSAQAIFPVASDLCDADVTNIIKVSGQFVPSTQCSNSGTYTNTWTVKDECGNISDTFTQVITIQDTTAPVFVGNLPHAITVSCDAVPQPENLEVLDNCNENLPIVFTEIKSDIQNGCASNYTLTRTWKTSDCSENTVSHTQIITVRDTKAPTGTAPTDVANLENIGLIPIGSPSDIKDATDNCSENVTITVSDTSNGGTGCEGNPYILTRTYTLSDCAGNNTELIQRFTVENIVTVSGVATPVSCLGGADGSIMVTNSAGSTVVITNDKNEVVSNNNLPAGIYTLTATSPVNNNGQNCTAAATVVITQPDYAVKISGYVINTDNHVGIANVPVTLIPQSPTTGPILLRLTGTDGSYNFSGMPAGNYLVQVQDGNLNSAYQLYPIDSSLFFTTLENCIIQKHDFEYGSSALPVLGDYVWYDTNSNGIQDEWYDANNDGIVTKNIPDANGAIDYKLWEWIDFNGDGSYKGTSNVGELNAGGFGNALSPNVIIHGPNGYHAEVIIGIQGFWRNRPETVNPFGDYTIKLVRDANLDNVAANLGAGGLVKVLPNLDKKNTAKANRAQLHTVCSTTTSSSYIVKVTPEDLVHLDADFGISCQTYLDIIANDDTAGAITISNTITPNVLNVLSNDTLEGVIVTPSDVVLTTVTPNPFLQLNPNGSVDVLPNAPEGTLTMVYQICEADQTSNCDTAIVIIIIAAPAPPTPVIANDDNYLNIGCNTYGLVGNILSNDLKGLLPATLELVNFTLLNNTKTDPNITIDLLGNINVTSLTPAGTYTYSYQICDKLSAENCDTAIVTIIVLPNEIINITSEACNDDSTLLNLSDLLPEGTPTTGTWIDTNNTNILQGNILNVYGQPLGNYTFEYKITDENCPRSIVLNVEVNDDCKVLACGNIIIHNAFSPNGDGINDVFVIDSIDDVTCYPENKVEIYNRWGVLVFETSAYNNITNAFDGKSRGRTSFKQSDGLPTGTYFYILNYKSLDGNNVLQNNKKDGYLYLSK